jgi:hypothetical protein
MHRLLVGFTQSTHMPYGLSSLAGRNSETRSKMEHTWKANDDGEEKD